METQLKKLKGNKGGYVPIERKAEARKTTKKPKKDTNKLFKPDPEWDNLLF